MTSASTSRTSRDTCAFFTLDSPGVRSSVRLERTCFAGLADGAISTLMHSETTAEGTSVAWDIALIAGYHRGVLVTAEYTPGPRGGPFDAKLASTLPALFEAQVDRLDAVTQLNCVFGRANAAPSTMMSSFSL